MTVKTVLTALIGSVLLAATVAAYLLIDTQTTSEPTTPTQVAPATAPAPIAPVPPVEQEPEPDPMVILVEANRTEARHDLADPEKSPFQVTTELATRAVRSFHDALADEKRFEELRDCRVAEGDCQKIESDALAAVLTWPLRDELFNDAYGLGELNTAYGPRELEDLLHEQIEEAYSRSDDPAERIVALALLQSRQFSDPQPLSPAVFDHLSDRSTPETMLLLDHYERAPVHTPAIIDHIAQVASEPSADPELRGRALRSLGFAETTEEFGQALELFDEDGLLTRKTALSTVVPALARCGLACLHDFDTLARGENPAGRLAALFAASRMDPALRDSVLGGVVQALDLHESLTHEERDQLAYLGLSSR